MSITIHEVGPLTPLPVESLDAQMQAFLRVHVALHQRANELFGSLSGIRPESLEWGRTWDNAVALNALAVEAQIQLTHAMEAAGMARVTAGEWTAYYQPAPRGRFAAARIEHTGAGQ